MLPKKIRMALISGLVVFSLVFAYRPAEAQSCPFPPCLSYNLSYYTNQRIYSGNCKKSKLPRAVETTVAATTDYPFSSNPWDSGWTGEMVLHNPNSSKASTFKLTTYQGGFVGIGASESLTILAGDTIVVPFTRVAIVLPSTDSERLEVTITPAAKLTCQTVSYYTWEHD